jgi:hypothetical protein
VPVGQSVSLTAISGFVLGAFVGALYGLSWAHLVILGLLTAASFVSVQAAWLAFQRDRHGVPVDLALLPPPPDRRKSTPASDVLDLIEDAVLDDRFTSEQEYVARVIELTRQLDSNQPKHKENPA